MPLIKLKQVDIYTETHGSGPDLVLITGLGSNLTHWGPLPGLLSPHFRLHLFDNRGSGRSTTDSPPFTLQAMADDTLALLDHLDLSQTHLLGHSMGSAIAQSLLHTHPNRITSAHLISSFDTLLPTARLQLTTTAKLLAANTPIPLIIETLLPWLWSSTFLSDPAHIEHALSHHLNDPYLQPPAGFIGQLHALRSFQTPDLSQNTIPTHILTGTEDLYTPPSQAQHLHSLIPHSHLHLFPHTGHMAPQEAPDRITHHLLTTLSP